MSCCGQKRKELVDGMRTSSPPKKTEPENFPLTTDRSERVFEYTGNSSLIINGLVSGKLYHFRFKGERLQVDYFDSHSMMAEKDLVLSTLPGSSY